MEITRFWLLYFPRLEAFDASSAHLRKPQLAWLFLYWGADLNLSAFPIGRNGKTRAFLKEKADTFPTNHVRSSEVIENDGRPVGTRTPDHYRAKVARIGTVINNLQDRGDCRSTRKSYFLWVGLWVENNHGK